MLKKAFLATSLLLSLTLLQPLTSFADTQDTTSATTMENCGAYLFEWRHVDCGNGHYFAILVGGDTLEERNVILNRGYDYAYTFNPMAYPRPWGTVPELVNIDGLWGIPENWALMPEGSQQTTQIVLLTNKTTFATKERYVDVVRLPRSVSSADLPPEVRKYLINVDGTDAGAYDNATPAGWTWNEEGFWRYRKPDGTFVSNGWLNIDEQSYYLDENGHMLADTITPDGFYVNTKGEKQRYTPGWMQGEKGWRYVQKNGYYAASTWLEDTDGKWYYFDMSGYMSVNETTPDGFHVGEDGSWDGQPSSIEYQKNLGPGYQQQAEAEE